MKIIHTVTVGIVAHNEARCIGALLRDVLKQILPDGVVLHKIIVISDGSTDKTEQVARNFIDTRIQVFARQPQEGKNTRLNELFRLNTSDTLVLFDADIRLQGRLVIQNLISPQLSDARVGLVGGNPLPIPSSTLAGRASYNWIRTLVHVRRIIRGGDNPYSCCGPIMALSKGFAKQIHLPGDVPDDRFLYFLSKEQNVRFVYQPEAIAWYSTAQTADDLLLQGARYRRSFEALRVYLGEQVVQTQFALSLRLRVAMLLSQIYRDPIAYIFMKYVHLKLFSMHKNLSFTMWQSIKSSKAYA